MINQHILHTSQHLLPLPPDSSLPVPLLYIFNIFYHNRPHLDLYLASLFLLLILFVCDNSQAHGWIGGWRGKLSISVSIIKRAVEFFVWKLIPQKTKANKIRLEFERLFLLYQQIKARETWIPTLIDLSETIIYVLCWIFPYGCKYITPSFMV